jgi:hypothetical protein
MTFSVGEAISKSFHRTVRMLFKPFDAGKWFVLGFCAWLAYLGERGGFNFNFNGGFPNQGQGGGGAGPDFSGVKPWIIEHLVLLAVIGGACFIAVMVLSLLMAWLKARGQFMFLDGVARNRGAVVEPWHRFRHLGNSLFWFNLVLGLVSLFGFFLIAGLALLVAWADIQARHFGVGAVLAIVAAVVLFLPWLFVIVLIHAVLRDFVVPIMYLRNVRTLDGWRIFGREVLHGHVLEFVVFYLVKYGLGILMMVIPLAACCLTCCLTCCISCIPYLGTVLMLPLLVFMRCYSLYFLEQAGPEWRIFAEEPGPMPVVTAALVVEVPPAPVQEGPSPTAS